MLDKKCVCNTITNRKCFYCETREHWQNLSDEQKAAGNNLIEALRQNLADKKILRLAIQEANRLNVDLKMIPLEMF